jgi:ATP-dependent RNA helicase SUPV3L1/SUV3
VFEIPIDLASVVSCPAEDWPAVLKGYGIAPAEKNPETGAVTLWRFIARARPDGDEKPARRPPRPEGAPARQEARPPRRDDKSGAGERPARRPENRQGGRPPAPPERRAKPLDPNSPFAALAALLPPPKPEKPPRSKKSPRPTESNAAAQGKFRYRPFR